MSDMTDFEVRRIRAKETVQSFFSVEMRVIPASEQRYKTVGENWIDDNGVWQIRVSNMGHWIFNFLVLLHEFIEMALCLSRGIRLLEIDEFDKQWEREKAKDDEGIMPDEAGFDPDSPNYAEHFFADGIERVVAQQFDVNFMDYQLSQDLADEQYGPQQ